MEHTLYVTSLGQFSIRYPTREGPGEITSQDSSSWRLWAFLQYLCIFHDKTITQEEMIDVLLNDLDSTNPASTIKTLLHRSRLLLEKLGFPDGKEALRYRRGIYSWDPELTVWTDIQEFDRLCDQFYADQAGKAGLKAARQAIALYGGDFLPSASGSPWTLSPRTYYHTKYLRLCCDAASALWEQGCLEEATDICRSATALDPYDEACHLLMMRLLCASGSKQMAAQYYNDVSNLLMVQLGISPSEEFTALYHQLSGSGEAEALEMDPRTILADLLDDERVSGSFFCEYNVFRDIYSLIVRSALRSGQVVQLALIALLDRDGSILPPGRRTAAMEEMRTAILAHCRSDDVFTQLSSSQYLLLLPSASYENGGMVVKRVLSAYRRTMLGMTTTVQCSTISALTAEQRLPAASQYLPAGLWKETKNKALG